MKIMYNIIQKRKLFKKDEWRNCGMDNPLIIFLSVLTGLVVGIVIMVIISKAGLNKDQQKASMLLKEAESKADSVSRQCWMVVHKLMN